MALDERLKRIKYDTKLRQECLKGRRDQSKMHGVSNALPFVRKDLRGIDGQVREEIREGEKGSCCILLERSMFQKRGKGFQTNCHPLVTDSLRAYSRL